MRYPVLALHETEQLARQMVDGYDPAIEPSVTWSGDGDDLTLGPIIECAARTSAEKDRLPEDADRDRFEGRASLDLYESLRSVPIEVLDDPGFWRYLSMAHFWDFIAWREAKPFAAGNFAKYVNAVSSTESVLPRMYLRAKALDGASDPSLAGALTSSTDFWRSHVIRVQTGSAPLVTAALAALQQRERLTTDGGLRDLARALNRSWTNIVLHTYDEDQASDFIRELRDVVLADLSETDQ